MSCMSTQKQGQGLCREREKEKETNLQNRHVFKKMCCCRVVPQLFKHYSFTILLVKLVKYLWRIYAWGGETPVHLSDVNLSSCRMLIHKRELSSKIILNQLKTSTQKNKTKWTNKKVIIQVVQRVAKKWEDEQVHFEMTPEVMLLQNHVVNNVLSDFTP